MCTEKNRRILPGDGISDLGGVLFYICRIVYNKFYFSSQRKNEMKYSNTAESLRAPTPPSSHSVPPTKRKPSFRFW